VRDPRKEIVEAGYDVLADGFLAWSASIEDDPRERFLGSFAERLPNGARVLDLGCGAGVPSTQRLAERFAVVGVDISASQIALARRHVPDATFLHADLTEVDFAEQSFAGITAFYAMSHVPRTEHAALFRRCCDWLEPGGLFLATLGAGELPDWTGDWLGVPMFFSSYDADTNRDLVRDAGFELLLDEVVEIREPEQRVRFLWVLAQRPAWQPRGS
jgi:SAM-dependent methyltransferase